MICFNRVRLRHRSLHSRLLLGGHQQQLLEFELTHHWSTDPQDGFTNRGRRLLYLATIVPRLAVNYDSGKFALVISRNPRLRAVIRLA